MVWRGSSERRTPEKMSKFIQNGNNNNYIKVQKESMESEDYKNVNFPLFFVLPGFCAVVFYANCLSGDFVHDDVMAVKNNGDVLQRTTLSQLFSNDFWGKPMWDNSSHKSYRPLCTLTFRLNHMLFGLNAVAFHVTNVLLHALATVLFTYVCKNVINFNKKSSTMAGLLFAVHPIHTEAVSGIVGRADVLACVFFLLSFISYVHSIGQVWSGCTPYTRKPSLFVLSILLAACAMLVKEHGLTVIGMFIVYDCYVQFQVRSNCVFHSNGNGYHHVKKSDKPYQPFVKRMTIILLSVALLIGFRIWMLDGMLPQFNNQDNPASFCTEFITRFMTYLHLLVFNAWLLLCPVTLSYDWQFNSIPLVETIFDVRNLATLLFIVFMVLYSLHCIFIAKETSQKTQILGLSLLVIPFLPASNLFIRVGFVVAERILYIPSMGYCILVIYGYDSLSYKFRRRHLFDRAFYFLLLLLALRTVIRNQVWQSREHLFRSGLETLPNNPKMHYNFANFLKDTDKFEEAMHHYRITLSLHPDHASAHNNLGTLLDDTEEAEVHYREAIRITPTHSNAHYNLGTLLHQNGQLEESIHMLQRAINLNPGYAQAQSYLASVLGDLDAGPEAEKMYRAVIENIPDDADGYNNLGAYLHKNDRLEEAEEMYKKSLAHRPDHVVVIINLARLAKSLNRFKDAEMYYLRAVEVRRDAITLDNLAVFYFNVGKPDQASVLFKEALEKYPESLDVKMHYASTLASLYEPSTAEKLLKEVLLHRPDSIEALKNLAIVYGLVKRHEEALVILDKTIKIAVDSHFDRATLIGLYQDKGNHLKDSKEFQQAITTYEELDKLEPGRFQTHLNLGVLYHMEDILEKAQYHYKAAQKIQPEDKLLLQNMDKLRKREKQLKQSKGNHTAR